MSEISENPELTKIITPENPMKSWLVQYVGEKFKPENGSVNTAMIIDAMAQEFPEFVLVLAEENFLRGYQQALYDIDYKPEEGKLSTPQESVENK
jgi:hypothetical protein